MKTSTGYAVIWDDTRAKWKAIKLNSNTVDMYYGGRNWFKTKEKALAAVIKANKTMIKNPSTSNDIKIKLISGSKEGLKKILRKAGYEVGSLNKNPTPSKSGYTVMYTTFGNTKLVHKQTIALARKLVRELYKKGIYSEILVGRR